MANSEVCTRKFSLRFRFHTCWTGLWTRFLGLISTPTTKGLPHFGGPICTVGLARKLQWHVASGWAAPFRIKWCKCVLRGGLVRRLAKHWF